MVQPHSDHDKDIRIVFGDFNISVDNDDVPPGAGAIAKAIAKHITGDTALQKRLARIQENSLRDLEDGE